MQKLHVKYNTIHLSRQQEESAFFLEISAIFDYVQCFMPAGRISFGAFFRGLEQRIPGDGFLHAAIDGTLPAGVY